MLLQVYKFLSVVDKSYTCYNFTNPLEIHLGKFTRAFIYPRSTRPLMVYIFLLSLSVRLFSGLVGEAASTPILFTPALLHGFNMTIGFVYFYKVSFQHLGLLAKTWGLRSVLKGSYFWSSLSDIFPEEAPKLSAKYISCQFMRKLLKFFPSAWSSW